MHLQAYTCVLPPSFWEHDLVLCYLGFMVSLACSAVSGDFSPSLYSRCRFLSVGESVSYQSERPPVIHLDMGLLTLFTPPTLLALPAMT